MPKFNRPNMPRPHVEVYTASHGKNWIYNALPSPVTSLYSMVMAGSITSLAYFAGDKFGPGKGTLWSVIAISIMTLIGLVAVGVRGIKARRAQAAQGAGFESALRGSASGWDGNASDPAEIARLDDLRNNFQKGINAFREYGKDIYSLPWYVIVGEPGSGKTEAIRRSELRFPDALQDKLQGTGGTYSMHWWFTNHAVILDTAGALIMQPEAAARFEEFLKLLRTHRPACPINGMILTIPTDSLLADAPPVAEQKARTLAVQLAIIQKTLDVRFPIYLMISKSDRLPGFREFFDAEGQSAFERQMTGWSNPSPLGEQFAPERIYEAVETIAQRLQSRALALLADPTPANPASRRMDEVDALYGFPQVLRSLAPRLRLYLDIIFQTGAWATKPPFFRGLFFTSALREGAQLDQQLAQALGMPLNQLPPGGIFSREKSVFLRDLFMEKVFPESGLVTRLFDIGAHLRKRLTTFYTATASLLLLALILAWVVKDRIEAQLRRDQFLWAAANNSWNNGTFLAMVTRSGSHSDKYPDRPAWTSTAGKPAEGSTTNLELLREIHGRIQEPVNLAWVFKPVPEWRDFLNRRREGFLTLFEGSVMKPVLDAARERILWDSARGATTSDATQKLMARAYEELLLLESWIVKGPGQKPDEAAWKEFFTHLLAYVLDPAPPGGVPAQPGAQPDQSAPAEPPVPLDQLTRHLSQMAAAVYGKEVDLTTRHWLSEGAIEHLPTAESALARGGEFILGNTLQAAEENDLKRKEAADAKAAALAQIQQTERNLLLMVDLKPNGPRLAVEEEGLRPFKQAVDSYSRILGKDSGVSRTALSLDVVLATAKRIREVAAMLETGGPDGLQTALRAANKIRGGSSAVPAATDLSPDNVWAAAHKRLTEYLRNFQEADPTQAGLTATGSIGNLKAKLTQAAQRAQELQTAPVPVPVPAAGGASPDAAAEDPSTLKINNYLKRFRGSPFISLAIRTYVNALQTELESRLRFPLVNCRAEHAERRDFEKDCEFLKKVEQDAADLQTLVDAVFECDEKRTLTLIFQKLQDVFDIKNALLSNTMTIKMGAVRAAKTVKVPVAPPAPVFTDPLQPPVPVIPPPPEELLVGYTYVTIYVGRTKELDEAPKGTIAPVKYDGFSPVRIILTLSKSGKDETQVSYTSPAGNWGILRDIARGKEDFRVTNDVTFSVESTPKLPGARWPVRTALGLGLSVEPRN